MNLEKIFFRYQEKLIGTTYGRKCVQKVGLSRLEAILHPPLKQLLFQKIETYRGTSNVLFVVAALPITLEMFEHCDEVFLFR